MAGRKAEWSGWRSREIQVSGSIGGGPVQVPGGGSGTPLLVESRGDLTSSFEIVSVRAGSYHQRAHSPIAALHRRGPSRFVLPADCDAFRVCRVRTREGAGGFSRWRARLIEPDALPPLTSEERTGKGTETFGHFEAKLYREHARALYYDFVDAPGTVICTPANGAPQMVRHTSAADQKGVLRLPQHGYVTVSADGRWKVSSR